MLRSKSKIIIPLVVFLTLSTLILKCMQVFNLFTLKPDILQVVYLFPVSFISSIAIAFAFDYKGDSKSILMYVFYAFINFLYIFLNTEVFLTDSKASLYISVVSCVVYIALNTLLLLIKTSNNDDTGEKDSSAYKLKALGSLNGFTILLCILVFWSLLLAVSTKVAFIYISICLVILFFTVFTLNIIKYRIISGIIDIGYRRLVIFDSLCIFLGMQLNYIFLNFIYTKGFPRAIAIIVFVVSIIPMLITTNKLDRAVSVPEVPETDKSKNIGRWINGIIIAASLLLIFLLNIIRIESDLAEIAGFIFLALSGIFNVLTSEKKKFAVGIALSVFFAILLVLTVVLTVQNYTK